MTGYMSDGRRRSLICTWVAVTLLVISGVAEWRYRKSGEAAQPTPDNGNFSGRFNPAQLTQVLQEVGWSAKAAKLFATLNAEYFDIQQQENPVAFETTIALLKRLGHYRTLQPFLEKHPQAAVLLARSSDPLLLKEAMSFEPPDDYAVISHFLVYADPQEALAFAKAVNANRALARKLMRRHMADALALLIFDRDQVWSAEYEGWIRDVLEAGLHDQEKLEQFQALVLIHGAEIRRKMSTSEEFRRLFRHKLWPQLERAVIANMNTTQLDNDNVLEQYLYYLEDPRIWDLLMLPLGGSLFEELGPYPVGLLYGYPPYVRPYPDDLHETVSQILLKGDGVTIQALENFREEPAFHGLLRRPWPPDFLACVANRLLNAGTNYPAEMRRFAAWPDHVVQEECSPPKRGIITWLPMYDLLYTIPKKWGEDRDITFGEWLSAGADVVTIIVPVVGSTIKTKIQVGRTAGTAASRASVKSLSSKAAGRYLLQQMSRSTWSGSAKTVSKDLIGKETAVRAGQKTWHIMKLLDVSLVPARNGMMAVSLQEKAGDVLSMAVQRYLRETADSFAINAAIQSPLGQKALSELTEVWRKNVSAWWLVSNDDYIVQRAVRKR